MSGLSGIFYNKIGDGTLYLPWCDHCQRYFFYPRLHCPDCLQEGWVWKKASGRGQVLTYTTVHVSSLPEFSARVPYIYALVELEEGVRLPANIDGDPGAVAVGAPVEFIAAGGGAATGLWFRPSKQ